MRFKCVNRSKWGKLSLLHPFCDRSKWGGGGGGDSVFYIHIAIEANGGGDSVFYIHIAIEANGGGGDSVFYIHIAIVCLSTRTLYALT